jgi:eukaryotic-like serine/threonine-protein kinase
VLLVEDLVVDERLVLKFLNPGVASDEEMMKRFIHELRYSRKITHRNVIRIYDFIALGGLYAISMEYFASHPLSDELKDEKPLPLQVAMQYGTDIATGMHVAHQAGIVHRDLKPANVLIDDEGLVKIVDFGVAAAGAGGDTQLTRTGYVIGSPKYMAPEQILGKKVDEKADIYSLGVILYEMLTGFAPYTRGDHMSVMYQHVQGKAKRAHELNPNVPRELSELVARCMAVDKSKRFTSMDEVPRRAGRVQRRGELALARIDAFLQLAMAQGCSDIHLAVGVPPMLRLRGDLLPIKFRDLSAQELEAYVNEILTPSQQACFRRATTWISPT